MSSSSGSLKANTWGSPPECRKSTVSDSSKPPRSTRSKPDGWTTEQLSVGANNERFYGGIRVDGEVFNVGDAVLVECEDRCEPQVTRIDALWQDVHGRKCFEGRWYYRPRPRSGQ